MPKVHITESLFKKIRKTFNTTEANKVINLIETLEKNPKKGRELSCIGNIIIKEIKYNSYRFYFITDGYKIKVLKIDELKDLIIKFIEMSSKNNQQKVINQIKNVLRKIGEGGFD